jgi:two-component system, sensor histidine kinase YesM
MWINMIFKRRNDSSRKSLSLTHKLIISYVLLTVIPMALLGLLAYSQYTSSIEKEVGKYTPRLLKQVNNNIENEIRKLEALPNLVYN